ncbi:4-hydroxy-3-methylbut-2-enyl diphosphate reductase [Dissulfurimicrobium hydrothermale]|uniref:4-hydroxy-3-methylbut-2-enyl diphosphate reductase n=1 Tax=Dissulfurimicrobium hydrothermale TaxID=1750598 RepID=UPI001EDB1470|nr:4-hydroxy-3-methylbut-2-enyl diphosphate reductase [Dissulfurimicrobium hydrothermale]UKL13802.1 4-hydroxy-3-methylbut-2-enyl diphosphate reductase [Dissulfurimicrobium hydrothermale]
MSKTMKVYLARIAGFCLGVKRAVDMALFTSRESKGQVYTFGPLIHNPSVLALLEARGVKVLRDVPASGEGVVIIRAHGAPPDQKEALVRAGFNVVDATCPRVVKVQMLARYYAKKGFKCLLIGDKGHPEVAGIMGYAGEGGMLISSEDDINALPAEIGRYVILAQTTQDEERFHEWSRLILERYPGGRVLNTICDATRRRQDEARRLAGLVDAVIVAGGKESANTKRLAGIVKECGKVAMAVETEEDLDKAVISNFRAVGITAGASTPNWIINRVAREVEAMPGAFEPASRRAAYGLMRFLHESTLLTAMAGGALAAASAMVQGFPLIPAAPISCLYIFAMHTLNRLIDREAGAYNDPLRVRFLIKHKVFFFGASVLALLLSLFMAFGLGSGPFMLLLVLTALGAFYAAPVIPAGRKRISLKDLPGSKAIFVSIAWAAVAVLVPGLEQPLDPCRLVWFVLSGTLVYLRTVLMELLDVQGDRIVGKESLVIAIGEGCALRLIRTGAVILALASISLSVPALFPCPLFVFLPAGVWFFYLSSLFYGERVRENMRLEFMVESVFFILFVSVFIARISHYLF